MGGFDSLALTGLPNGNSTQSVPTAGIATALRAWENIQILFIGHHGIFSQCFPRRS